MSTKAWENHGGVGECERVGGFNPNGPCSRDVRQRPLSVLINRSTLSGIGTASSNIGFTMSASNSARPCPRSRCTAIWHARLPLH